MRYVISKETVDKVLTALEDNFFGGDRGEYNNDDIIEAHEALEKEIKDQEDSL